MDCESDDRSVTSEKMAARGPRRFSRMARSAPFKGGVREGGGVRGGLASDEGQREDGRANGQSRAEDGVGDARAERGDGVGEGGGDTEAGILKEEGQMLERGRQKERKIQKCLLFLFF